MANKHLESLKFPGLSDTYTMTPEIASEYSNSATYAVGDYAVHSGKLYQCTTAIATAEAWTAAHWTDAKLADDVSQLKEDLDNTSAPVMITGQAIGNDGGVFNNALCDCSDFIQVESGKKIRLEKVDSGEILGCCFYNVNKTFLSKYTATTGITITIETTIPDNAYYIRLTSRTGVQPTLSIMDLYPDYILPAYNTIPTVEKTSNVLSPYLNNIATPADLTLTGYINPTTGAVGSVSAWRHTDYLPVIAGREFETTVPTVATALTVGIAFYNSELEFISGVTGRTYTSSPLYYVEKVTTPDNAAFARFCFRTANVDEFYAKIDTFETLQSEIDSLSVNTYAMQMFEKIGVISDSISVGWGSSSSRRNTGISWVQQMARRLGCTAYNLGASGVDPIEWFQPDFEFAQYCYTQYQSVGFCDLYIIGLGLNGGTLGTTADINQSDYTQNAESFYGQYARIIQMINAEHPKSIVICLTEPTTRISSYDQAVRNICALSYIDAQLVDLELDYFDLFNTPEITAQHTADGLHFTPYGYSLLADATVKAISDYISKNPDPFKLVGIN